ncbi:MAG: DUF5320 domain-containing protein [Thermoplasmata archaeon]
MFGRPFGGRGRGYGATLGYCPVTGLPRGWRFNPYYYQNQYTNPYYPEYPFYGGYVNSASPQNINPNFNEKEMLENELKYLQERIEQINRRLKELQ